MDEEKINALKSGLRVCTDREFMDNLFNVYKVSDNKEKLSIIKDVMGNPKTFYSCGDEVPLDVKYELTVQAFLTGGWKIVLGMK